MSLTFDEVRHGYRRSRPVLQGFTWTVPPGRTVMLGPNGAGKSTLLRLGAGVLSPWQGEILIGDDRMSGGRAGRRARRSLGWMPQDVRPLAGLTAREQVAYAAWLRGLPRAEALAGAAAALEAVGLTEKAGERSSTLSGGQLRRVGLAQALAHRPRVLLLDEPTVGLDPAQRARFRSVLSSLDPALPVVVSTHQVDDLHELFEHVVILVRGRIRWQGATADFLSLAPADDPRRAETAYAAFTGQED